MLTTQSRIDSVLNASAIGVSIPKVVNFELRQLKISSMDTYPNLPVIRLGKKIERVFSFLIQNSSNYSVLKENIQVIDQKITIGEFDFIIENNETKEISHLEIVYKFYLYDPNQSAIELERWIGPNRKDSFIEKFEKLKLKQFPLLYHPKTARVLNDLDINSMQQKLCFMASLFVPFSLLNQPIASINNSSIIGYWLTFNEFNSISQTDNEYFLPKKQDWGIAPNVNSTWYSGSEIRVELYECLDRHFSPLLWIKTTESTYEQCFIVWW